MNKLFYLTLLLFIGSFNLAHASQKYQVIFVNDSTHKISIQAVAGECMHTWDVPSQWVDLNPGQTLPTLTLEDKNSGNCINSNKVASWAVKQDQTTDQVMQVSMNHTRPNSHSWPTSITGGTNPSLNIQLSGGFCQIKVGYVNCLNNPVDNVTNGGEIKFIFTDKPNF